MNCSTPGSRPVCWGCHTRRIWAAPGGSVLDLALVSEEIGQHQRRPRDGLCRRVVLRTDGRAQGLRRAEAEMDPAHDRRPDQVLDRDFRTRCRLRCRRHPHQRAQGRQRLGAQRPQGVAVGRGRQGQCDLPLCAHRHGRALPAGHVAVPGRQQPARRLDEEARYARPLLHGHLRGHAGQRARAGGSAHRRRQQGLGLPAVGPADRADHGRGLRCRLGAGRGRSRAGLCERAQAIRPRRSAISSRSRICWPTCRPRSRRRAR